MTQVVERTVLVPDSLAGRRLDSALAELLPEFSLSLIKTWIESGQVRARGGERLRPRSTGAPIPIPGVFIPAAATRARGGTPPSSGWTVEFSAPPHYPVQAHFFIGKDCICSEAGNRTAALERVLELRLAARALRPVMRRRMNRSMGRCLPALIQPPIVWRRMNPSLGLGSGIPASDAPHNRGLNQRFGIRESL